jgi:phosphoglycerate dehydrogenase-like enzyme
MKPSAILLSIGRGPTIVTDDLLEALRSGSISGAGLDVTDPEPLPPDHPLWSEPRAIITPHVSSGGSDPLLRFGLLVENIRRYQAGEPLLNPVDIDAGY